MATNFNYNYDDIFVEFRGLFLERTRERFDDMASCRTAILQGAADSDELFRTFMRDLHTLKGDGANYGFHSLSAISHQLEDRLVRISREDFAACTFVTDYLDAMAEIVETAKEPDEAALRRLLAELASAADAALATAAGSQTVVLVSASETMGQIVRAALESHGMEVVSFVNPFEALSYLVRRKPDAVISTGQLEALTGYDLIRALAVMETTRTIRTILVTSSTPSPARLRSLPGRAAVVSVGPDMSADLLSALERQES